MIWYSAFMFVLIVGFFDIHPTTEETYILWGMVVVWVIALIGESYGWWKDVPQPQGNVSSEQLEADRESKQIKRYPL